MFLKISLWPQMTLNLETFSISLVIWSEFSLGRKFFYICIKYCIYNIIFNSKHISKVSSSKAITYSKIPVLWGITIYNVISSLIKYDIINTVFDTDIEEFPSERKFTSYYF
jgi:hypothetical protein